jgi:hypothetical protein
VAVLLGQPGYEPILRQLAKEPVPAAGAPTLVETGIVLAAWLAVAGKTVLARVVDERGLVVIPFGEDHCGVARGSPCPERPRLTAYSQFLYVPADVFWQSWMSTPSGSVQFEIVRPDCWFSNAS